MPGVVGGVAWTIVGSADFKPSIYAPAVSIVGSSQPPPPPNSFVLLENGFYLLLESGHKIILE